LRWIPELLISPIFLAVVAAGGAWMSLRASDGDTECRQTQSQISDSLNISKLDALLVSQMAIRTDITKMRLAGAKDVDDLLERSATVEAKAQEISNMYLITQ
jgi:hypothetical protein